MPRSNAHSFRIVVQHFREHQRSAYRLVAYGGDGGDYTSQSGEFESRDNLLKALRSVAPDFDESAILVRKDALETYIAFTGDMELDDSQLSRLGLKERRRS